MCTGTPCKQLSPAAALVEITDLKIQARTITARIEALTDAAPGRLTAVDAETLGDAWAAANNLQSHLISVGLALEPLRDK